MSISVISICTFLSHVMSIPSLYIRLTCNVCPLYIPLTCNAHPHYTPLTCKVCPLYTPFTCNVHPLYIPLTCNVFPLFPITFLSRRRAYFSFSTDGRTDGRTHYHLDFFAAKNQIIGHLYSIFHAVRIVPSVPPPLLTYRSP